MFCSKFKAAIKKLLNQYDSFLEAHVEAALSITTGIKKVIGSPVVDLLTAIIPGNLDDTIKDKLRIILDKAVLALSVIEQCKSATDAESRLKCFVMHLSQMEPQLRDAILQKLASMMVGELDGQRFKQSIYDLFTQAGYTAVNHCQ
jgi:hypothetical protein